MELNERVAKRYLSAYRKGDIEIKVDTPEDRDANFSVGLYRGDSHVGWCEAHVEAYTIHELEDFNCYKDIMSVTATWLADMEEATNAVTGVEGILVVEVVSSELEESLQGKKCGYQMYLKLIQEVYKEYGRIPFVFIPNYCHNRSTSDEALRVWASFARKYPSEGDVILITRYPNR
jgi:hypothetical protein